MLARTNHRWVSESGVLDLFLFPGPSPQLVSQQFHTLTGFAPLAPLFALGKHQCRWNYVSQKDLLEVHDKFEGYDIPYDVLWLDIEHTDGKRYFTWDKRHFAQPKEMTDRLSAYGRKLVTIVDPHIKATPDYAVYSELKSQDLLTKKKTWQYSDVVVGEGEAMIKVVEAIFIFVSYFTTYFCFLTGFGGELGVPLSSDRLPSPNRTPASPAPRPTTTPRSTATSLGSTRWSPTRA